MKSNFSKVLTVILSWSLAAGPLTSTYADLVFKKNVKNLVVTTPVEPDSPTLSLSTSASSLNFGSISVGSASNVQTISVLNNGTQSVSIGQLTVPASFSATSSCMQGMSLAVGNTCDISISFSPNSVGLQQGSVTLASSAGTKSIVVSGTGTAVLAPIGELSANSISFSGVSVGSTSSSQAVLLQNSGTGTLTVAGSPTLRTGSSLMFNSLTSDCANNALAPGQSCAISIKFSPENTSAQTGIIDLSTNAGDFSIALSGTGQSIAVPSPSVTIQSTATSVVEGGSFTLTANASAGVGHNITGYSWTVISGPASISGSSSSSSAVVQTTGAGSVVVQVSATSDTGASAQANINLTAIAGTPSVSLSTNSLNFGSHIQGTTSNAQDVLVQNNGNVAVTLGNATTTGSAFNTTTSCENGASLAVGASCVLSITFTAGAGAATGSVSLQTSAGAQTVNLSGNGQTLMTAYVSGNVHDVVAASGAFGSVSVGSSKDLEFYVLRAGDVGTLTITATASGSGSFKILNAKAIHTYYQAGYDWTYETIPGANCALTDNYHVTCSEYYSNGTTYGNILVTVRYTPAAGGSETGTLSIAHNGSNATPLTVSLTGTGTTAPNVQTSVSSIAFDNTTNVANIGATTTSTAFTVYNSGTGATTISSVALKAGSSARFGAPTTTCSVGFSLAANSANSCTVAVPFTPTDTGTVTGTVQITTADGTIKEVSLTGTGQGVVGALAAAAGSSTAFGSVALGDSAQRTFTYTNNGNIAANNTYASVSGTGMTVLSSTCGLVGAKVSISAGASCTVVVKFTPTTVGAVASPSLSITSSAYNSPNSLALSATGASAYITSGASGRYYSNGTYAASCNAYLNSSGSYAYSGSTGDGTYIIQPSGQAATSVYCDMTNNGGGWTLVMRGLGGTTAGTDWYTTGALNAAQNGASDASTGATFKMTDAFINAARNGGIYRLKSDGNMSYTRFVGAFTYAHTTAVAGTARTTYSNAALSSGSLVFSAANPGYYKGISDDKGSWQSYFTTNYSTNGSTTSGIWITGDGTAYASAPGASHFCGGGTSGCNMTMWVR